MVAANYGRTIFVYNNVQTKQVVYSLTRSLNNHDAIKQISFVGKKSVPRALRKDHWTPLASVSFPNPAIGLKTYHKLREFRKLHETQYPEDMKFKTSMKERKYKLMDQKANTVADLAKSLEIEIGRAGKESQPIGPGEITVRWQDILDAHYAREWPEVVVHGSQGRPSRYTAPLRVPETKGESKEAAV